MRELLALVVALSVIAVPAYPQTADKLIVIAAPGVTKSESKDWHNSLGVSGQDLVLNCPKCMPIQTNQTGVIWSTRPTAILCSPGYGEITSR